MKILITTDWYKPVINGVVTSVINLKDELEKAGHEVRVLTLSPDGKQKYEEDTYYLKSFRVKVYPQARATHNFHSVFLPDILDWHPDIIHSQCEWFSFIFAKYIAIKLNIPIVHTYHTIYEDYTHYLLHGTGLTKKLVLFGTNRIVNSMDYVIAPTIKTRNLLLSYGIENPIFTIPTGINLNKYRPRISETRRLELLDTLGIPKDKTVIISIGRLAYEKNIDELIDDMILLKESHPEIFLILVGGGPYENTLRERVASLGLETNILFTGMISPDEVPEYFQIGKVFVCASQSEAQGLTYIEALASGIPLLCKYDQCLENVLVEGTNGYFYDNAEEFIQKLIHLLNTPDEYAQFCKNAEQTAEKYSKEVFGKRVLEVYQDALKNFKGHASIRARLIPMLRMYR
ncbi:glycosyltransferase [Clostridium aminobutyricum]|uniref:Glycosyltransferase n=1 Tax=Clostridium aminobutyricum TaxID=33953 RepID=A0A939D8C7_CLOAM|nr:glycosyltransferase [Clostridium aminobutyricum]MBN7773001.1 glycosyltransferase [Clostridium aminobutyricum]